MATTEIATTAPPARAHIALVVDRSGSMYKIKDDVEGGVDRFLADQAAQPGATTATLYLFDHEFERAYGPGPAAGAPPCRLTPRGSTALLDAIGRAVAETADHAAALPPGTLIYLVIATDGRENASAEWDPAATRALLEQKRAQGWQVVFISADLAAVTEARDTGVPATSSAGFEPTQEGTLHAFTALSASVTRSRDTGNPVDLHL